jgi:hypothetical protein
MNPVLQQISLHRVAVKHASIVVHWQVKELIEEQFCNVKAVALDSVIAMTESVGYPTFQKWPG